MINWKKSVISRDIKIKDAVKNLNNGTTQICLVVDRQHKFIGTITDGDIRRAFLKGYRLQDRITNIINKKYKFVSKNFNKDRAIQVMKKFQIRHLPVIEKSKILNVFFLDQNVDTVKRIKKNFVIMAGGMGTRLLPLTKNLPKPMVKIKNKPMLEHLILKAKKEGFYNFIIIVHHLKDKIINYFKNGNDFGVKIKYVAEKKALGTAGGLNLIKKIVSNNFILSNADVISDLKFKNLIDFHGNESFATIAVKVIDSRENYGLVKISNEKIISFQEKPITKKYINSGVYAFNKNCLKHIRKNEKLDMITFLKRLKDNNKTIKAFPIYENWQDIGLKKKLKKLLD